MLGRYEQFFIVFAIAVTFLHPGIITLFALKVSFPATVGVADITFMVLKTRFPAASETVAELDAVFTTLVAVEVSVFEPTIFVAVTATFK